MRQKAKSTVAVAAGASHLDAKWAVASLKMHGNRHSRCGRPNVVDQSKVISLLEGTGRIALIEARWASALHDDLHDGCNTLGHLHQGEEPVKIDMSRGMAFDGSITFGPPRVPVFRACDGGDRPFRIQRACARDDVVGSTYTFTSRTIPASKTVSH